MKSKGFGIWNRISDILSFWRSIKNCSEKHWKKRRLCRLISRWALSWRLDLGISAEVITRRCSRSMAVFQKLSVKSTSWFKNKRKLKQRKRRRRANLKLMLFPISNWWRSKNFVRRKKTCGRFWLRWRELIFQHNDDLNSQNCYKILLQ